MTEKNTSDDQKIDVVNLGATEAKKPEASFLRLVMTLTIAGLLSGTGIIGIYEATLPTITANKARELREAVFKVLPGVTQMQKLVLQDGKLVATQKTEKGEEPVYAGYDSDRQFVGYAMPAEGAGFQDTIKLLYGFKPDTRRIVGMEILQSLETPGLGDKIFKDLEFVANFDDLAAEPEVVAVKKSKKSAPNEIDAITGATISSKAVVRIINEKNKVWLSHILVAGPELIVGPPAAEGAGTGKSAVQ